MVGQKRSAASTATPSSDPSVVKKTRFLDPSEDPINFAEQVDAALENPSALKKGRVRTDGYDSDSSEDEEGERRKSGKDEGDDDMFAVEEKEEQGTTRGKKKEEYLRLGDIEGQEFNDSGNSDSESLEGEPEDEDDAERRKKLGMGYELSSFNMREEMEEGKFTEDGSYVRTFDPHGVHDRWMDGLNDKEIKEARRRKRHQDKIQQEKIEAEEKELQESGGKFKLETDLLSQLKKGETVLEALQRLGTAAKKEAKSKGTKPLRNEKSKGYSADCIEHITHLASSIMSLGDTEIYSKSYEELVRSVRASGSVGPSWEPPSADRKFEYKWAGTNDDDCQIFGPFGEEEVLLWYKASYFGPNGEKIKLREVGGEWCNWDDLL